MNTPRLVSLSRLVLVGSAALLLAPYMGTAASLTWKGNTSEDIAAANWLNGTNPASPAASGDSLSFGVAGTSGTSLTNTGSFSVTGINFLAGASAYTLSGNSITVVGGIDNKSSVVQTINNNIAFDTAAGRNITGTGLTVFGGNITAGTLNLQTTGTTTFSGSLNATASLGLSSGAAIISGNATAGNFFLNANRLTVSGAGTLTLGAGTVSVGVGGIFTIDNTDTNVNNRLSNVTYRGQGGSINYISNNSVGGSTDTITKLQLDEQVRTVINLTANTSGSTVLKVDSMGTKTQGATLLVQGKNLGVTPGADTTNLVFVNQGTLSFLGANGANGSKTISILAWALGQDTAKTGNDQYGFLTAYAGGTLDTTKGLRFLTAEEYATTITNGGTQQDNVNLTSISGLTGNTIINSLRLDNGGGVTVDGALTINSGAILALEGNGGISGGTLKLAINREFVITTVGDLTLDSALAATTSGNVGLTKTGAGTLTITAASSRTGNNFINQGTLKLSGNGNLGAAGNALYIRGTGTLLDLNGKNLSVGALQTNSSSDKDNGITNNGAGTAVLTLGDGSTTTAGSFYGRITDGVGKIAVIKKGENRQTLYGASTYSGGTTVESGTLTQGTANALGSTTGTLTVTGGLVDMGSYSLNVGALNGTGGSVRNSNTTSGMPSFTVGNGDASGSYAGQIMNDTGTKSINLVKSGTGTQVLSGANTYTGTTTINAGTLQFTKKTSLYNGGTAAAWNATNIKVANGATLAVNVGGAEGFSANDILSLLGIGGSATTGFISGSILGLDTTNGDFEYSFGITNAYAGSSLGLKKLGQNQLTLSGANTYTGTTTVAAGTLNIKGSLSGGPVNVASGATLGGIGIIDGAVTMSGKLAAGDGGIGTLKTGNLTFGNTSTFDVEIRDGGVSDKVEVNGSVTIIDGAELKLTLSGVTGPTAGDTFFLIDNNDTDLIAGSFFSFTSDTGLVSLTEGKQFRWNNQDWLITYQANAGTLAFSGGNDVAIQLQAIPEPSTWALLVGGLGMLFSMQGLRKRSKAS